MATKKAARLSVTQIRSAIGQKPAARQTLKALGCKRIGSQVFHDDGPVVRGMIDTVRHLVRVEEVK